jgi:hypothetical protein
MVPPLDEWVGFTSLNFARLLVDPLKQQHMRAQGEKAEQKEAAAYRTSDRPPLRQLLSGDRAEDYKRVRDLQKQGAGLNGGPSQFRFARQHRLDE